MIPFHRFFGRPVLATSLLLLAGAATGHAQTILNPSFELPNTNTYVQGGGNNWTLSGNGYVLSNSFGRGITPYGTQYFNPDPGSSDSQTVSGFTLGRTYQLTAAGTIYGGPNSSITLAVSGGATASQTFVLGPTFNTYALNFTPTTSTNITITVGNAATSDAGIKIDNVQVGFAPTVPEPSTWAFVTAGAGLLGMGVLRRRRGAAVQM